MPLITIPPLVVVVLLVQLRSQPALAWNNGAALKPPLGFANWNLFGCNYTDSTFREMADAFVSTGLVRTLDSSALEICLPTTSPCPVVASGPCSLCGPNRQAKVWRGMHCAVTGRPGRRVGWSVYARAGVHRP